MDASTRSQYSTLDSQINAVIKSGNGYTRTPRLSNALNVVQETEYDLTLDVVDPSGAVVQVNSGFVPLRAKPTIAERARDARQGRRAGEPARLSHPFALRRRRRLPRRRGIDERDLGTRVVGWRSTWR